MGKTKNYLAVAVCLFLLLFYATETLAQARIANDPTRISVGARPMGMGKTFTSVADDPAAIFLNPAGLGTLSNLQITSMSSKFLNEVDYVQLAGALPTKFGTVGIGFGGNGISFRAPSPEVIIIGNQEKIIPSPSGEVNYSWTDSALLFSLGNKFDIWQFKNIYLGASLKLYSQSLSGSNMSPITASGMDIDLGALYQPLPELNIAATAQNILPSSIGGGMKWSNGIQESLPALGRLGLSYRLLGEKGRTQWMDQELSLSFDYEFHPTRSNASATTHVGLEWSPVDLITLRLGQDGSDLTYGVGVLLDGFRFDYAYHNYLGLTSAATNYFSLSYGIWKKKPAVKEYLTLISPKDNAIFYADKITLRGKVLNKEVDQVKIKGETLPVSEDKLFEKEIDLKTGRNEASVEAYDFENNLLEAVSWKGLKLLSFNDITSDYWAKLPIEVLATLDIIKGYPGGLFKPEGNITRAEMCTLLMKSRVSSPESRVGPETRDTRPATGFKDVSAKHWAAQYITQAAEEGIVKGYPGDLFKPTGNITRAEGVIMIARFAGLGETRLLESPFPDVPGRHWAAREISTAKEAGILKYLEGRYFEPNKMLTRAEVAEMLYHTGIIKKILEEKGFLDFLQ